jgi:hypothetical protein
MEVGASSRLSQAVAWVSSRRGPFFIADITLSAMTLPGPFEALAMCASSWPKSECKST